MIFSSQRERSHTIYCVFNGDWGYSPTSRFGKNPVREFYAKSQGVYHLALLATNVSKKADSTLSHIPLILSNNMHLSQKRVIFFTYLL